MTAVRKRFFEIRYGYWKMLAASLQTLTKTPHLFIYFFSPPDRFLCHRRCQTDFDDRRGCRFFFGFKTPLQFISTSAINRWRALSPIVRKKRGRKNEKGRDLSSSFSKQMSSIHSSHFFMHKNTRRSRRTGLL